MIDGRVTLSIILAIAAIGMISILIDMTRDDKEVGIVKKQAKKKEISDDFVINEDVFDD